MPDFSHCPVSLSADGGIHPLFTVSLAPLSDAVSSASDLLSFFHQNPQVVQVGDILAINDELYKVVEGEFSENTDFMHKVLDFKASTSADTQSEPVGKKRETIERIKSDINDNYFKCYDERVVSETGSLN